MQDCRSRMHESVTSALALTAMDHPSNCAIYEALLVTSDAEMLSVAPVVLSAVEEPSLYHLIVPSAAICVAVSSVPAR